MLANQISLFLPSFHFYQFHRPAHLDEEKSEQFNTCKDRLPFFPLPTVT